jgi:CRISPR-associated protein Csb2
MPTYFCLTVRFLQPYSHGRGNDGEPEWPPSPLRAFQALVAAAAGRWNERTQLEYAAPAFRWLERQPAPTIVAAPGTRSDVKYRLYVPDNVADKVAKSWSARREASIADYRTEKDVCPTHLLGDAVHYLFPVPEPGLELETHRNTLIGAARSITHLGWGVDMVAGNATILSPKEAAKLSGERWQPMKTVSASGLRVPIKGTLNNLANKHAAFLNRLSGVSFKPVPPLSAYRVVGYRRVTDPPHRPIVAFELWQPADQLAALPAGKSRFRPFDPLRGTVRVAAMVRHAADEAARATGWPAERISEYVHGHGPAGPTRGAPDTPRFAYLPLPSIEERTRKEGGRQTVVSAIRRVLVVEPPGGTGEQVAWARRALSGRELTDGRTGRPAALLSLIPGSDPRVRHYLGGATGSPTWSTVTPVVLPGHDGRGSAKAERLLRKAIQQAGLSATLAENAELEWRNAGFLPGVDPAVRYEPPAHINAYTRCHVRVRWRGPAGEPVAVRGPLVIGAGRYCGFGLFVADEQ